MKRNRLVINYTAKIILFSFAVYVFFNCYMIFSCLYASHQITQNTEQEFLRIKIYGSSSSSEGNTVSGSFSVIDSNGNEIAVIERSWKGAYLGVSFGQVKFNNKYYVFPVKIFGKNRIIEERSERKKGTNLEKYYNDYGQCMLLGYGSSLKDRRNLYKISAFANNKYPLLTLGLVNTFTIDLSNCKTNTYYSISYNQDGRLIIQEI